MQNKDWTALGLSIDQYRLQIRTEEQVVLRGLKDRVCKGFNDELDQQDTLTVQNIGFAMCFHTSSQWRCFR